MWTVRKSELLSQCGLQDSAVRAELSDNSANVRPPQSAVKVALRFLAVVRHDGSRAFIARRSGWFLVGRSCRASAQVDSLAQVLSRVS